MIIFAVLTTLKVIGEMLEWLKRHAWKACGLQKGLASSNLALSAENGFADMQSRFIFAASQETDQIMNKKETRAACADLPTNNK